VSVVAGVPYGHEGRGFQKRASVVVWDSVFLYIGVSNDTFLLYRIFGIFLVYSSARHFIWPLLFLHLAPCHYSCLASLFFFSDGDVLCGAMLFSRKDGDMRLCRQ